MKINYKTQHQHQKIIIDFKVVNAIIHPNYNSQEQILQKIIWGFNLIIKTKCPTKWIIEDLETGQRYRANGKTEIGQMFTLISWMIVNLNRF